MKDLWLPGPSRRLLLVGCYPPPWGGISVHLHALRTLAGNARIEMEVLDIGAGHGERSGVDRIHDGGSHARFAAGLIRAALRQDPVHVHIPGNNLKAWAVAVAASLPARGRERRLLTVHSGLAPALLDGSDLARKAARACGRGYGRILCTNATIAQALQGAGVPRSMLQVVSPFLGAVRGSKEAPAAALAARQRFSTVLSCALAPGPQYGEEVLLEALQILLSRGVRVGALVFGPGTLDPAFSRRLGSRGLLDTVVPLGELDHETSLATIEGSTIFLRPTLADGDSLSVREALGLGIDVVASDASPRPPGTAVFRSGDAAHLAARIEAIARRLQVDRSAQRRREAPGASEAESSILAAWRRIGADPATEGAWS